MVREDNWLAIRRGPGELREARLGLPNADRPHACPPIGTHLAGDHTPEERGVTTCPSASALRRAM